VLDEVVERGEKILDEVEQLAAETLLTVETELVQARDTGPALVDEAVEWGADLIVMGLPYKRRFGEFNLGKTVPYVLKNATCRVMLFREHRTRDLAPSTEIDATLAEPSLLHQAPSPSLHTPGHATDFDRGANPGC
jgi:hypothetical protein